MVAEYKELHVAIVTPLCKGRICLCLADARRRLLKVVGAALCGSCVNE